MIHQLRQRPKVIRATPRTLSQSGGDILESGRVTWRLWLVKLHAEICCKEYRGSKTRRSSNFILVESELIYDGHYLESTSTTRRGCLLIKYVASLCEDQCFNVTRERSRITRFVVLSRLFQRSTTHKILLQSSHPQEQAFLKYRDVLRHINGRD